MMKMEKNGIFVPMPTILKAEDIATLTKKRQKVLLSLFHGEKTLSNLVLNIKDDTDSSTAFKILSNFVKRKFVQKDDNKIYSLTLEGKLLSLMLARPNGISEETIRNRLDKILKENFEIEPEENRKEIIENWRDLSEIINERPETY